MNAVGKIPVTQSLAPYAIAGVGIYAVSVSDASITYQARTSRGAELASHLRPRSGSTWVWAPS